MAELWRLYKQSSPEVQHRALSTLKAVEANLDFDDHIARAKRGMYWQPIMKGRFSNG